MCLEPCLEIRMQYQIYCQQSLEDGSQSGTLACLDACDEGYRNDLGQKSLDQLMHVSCRIGSLSSLTL